MSDKKIIKRPKLSSEVYHLKNIILQELARLKVDIEDKKAEVLAEKIFHQQEESQKLIKETKTKTPYLLEEKEKKIKDTEERLKQKKEEIKNKEQELKELDKKLIETAGKEEKLKASIQKKEERLNRLRQEVEKLEEKQQVVLAKIANVQKSAFEEGYLEGQKMGSEEGKKEIIDRLQFVEGLIKETEEELSKIIKRATKECEEIFLSSERQAIKLALDIAKKIIRSEISTRPEIIAKVAKEAIRQVVESQKAKIRINPKDLEILKSYKNEIMAAQEGIKNLEIIVDENIERGGCVVETELGNIDAKIGTQIEQVEKGLGV